MASPAGRLAGCEEAQTPEVRVGTGAIIILLAAAFVVGFIIQRFGTDRGDLRWLATGVVAALGGYIASEFLAPASAWGWEWDGLAVLPAMIAVVVVGVLADAAMRKFMTI